MDFAYSSHVFKLSKGKIKMNFLKLLSIPGIVIALSVVNPLYSSENSVFEEESESKTNRLPNSEVLAERYGYKDFDVSYPFLTIVASVATPI